MLATMAPLAVALAGVMVSWISMLATEWPLAFVLAGVMVSLISMLATAWPHASCSRGWGLSDLLG